MIVIDTTSQTEEDHQRDQMSQQRGELQTQRQQEEQLRLQMQQQQQEEQLRLQQDFFDESVEHQWDDSFEKGMLFYN
jgi:hypothetical protein